MITQTSPVWVTDIYSDIDPETVRFVRYDHARYRTIVEFFNGVRIVFAGDRDTETVRATVYNGREVVEESYTNTLEDVREVIDNFS